MSSKSRNKGNRGERELLHLLRDRGLKINKVPLSGAAPDYPGDLEEENGDLWEVKLRSQGFKKPYDWLQGCKVLAFRGDRQQWLVCMELDEFLKRIGNGNAPD